ncbi:hypothetical protein COCOR_04070 [Corallococcus coralloides DSM 2259]|uniref:Lipoprotein n=1 Tax=Corallococcus coralloides (strain ATCC 25202 / DSM 2259 / NBRC 100086 / M2) TaxID=1144275 RepID=H8MVT9_CORCM|nr:hypothetical protein [Corallococcus coralloides]AFE05610.1 hypothetical protein COCOR_04070 [Corallococcus coralloides DSM 2259]
MNLLRLSVVGAGVAFLVAGCGGRRSNGKVDFSQMGPSINSKRYANLEKIAAKDLKCQEELTPQYLGENQYQMIGCNAEGVYELKCKVGQCSWIPDVRARAEFDMGCSRFDLKTSKLDRVTTGVAGCGKRATYRLSTAGRGYSWVLNSPVAQDELSAPAPAAAPEPAPAPVDEVPVPTEL